jgi:Flp pilus assembly protein TadG
LRKLAITASHCAANRLCRLRNWRSILIGPSENQSEDLSESGAALVEFTVLAPLFFLLVFGIIEFGSIFFLQNTMLNAAREAARSMAVQGLTSSQAQTIATNYLTGYTEAFTYSIRDNCLDTPKVQDVTVTITTSASAASLVNYMGLFTGQTLNSTVKMRKELAC